VIVDGIWIYREAAKVGERSAGFENRDESIFLPQRRKGRKGTQRKSGRLRCFEEDEFNAELQRSRRVARRF
jgi:hypothetical protein